MTLFSPTLLLFAAARDRATKNQLTLAIARLGDKPRPSGVKKMAGADGFWRIRVGERRIIYSFRDVPVFDVLS